mgnify:CR=1 FL=1
MNNNNRMLYSLILSVILILVGVKLIKTPTEKLVKYTGFGMSIAGLGLLVLEFTQNKKSIVDSTLATLKMQTTTTSPSPMPKGGPLPKGGPMPKAGPMPKNEPDDTNKDDNIPPQNPGAAFLLTLLIIAAGLTFIL